MKKIVVLLGLMVLLFGCVAPITEQIERKKVTPHEELVEKSGKCYKNTINFITLCLKNPAGALTALDKKLKEFEDVQNPASCPRSVSSLSNEIKNYLKPCIRSSH